jgi:hypothetical protein
MTKKIFDTYPNPYLSKTCAFTLKNGKKLIGFVKSLGSDRTDGTGDTVHFYLDKSRRIRLIDIADVTTTITIRRRK